MKSRARIHALILSGGDSSRMGSPKALLSFQGKSFLQHCIGIFGDDSIASITVVTGIAHEAIEKHVQQHRLNVSLIKNPRSDQGQYSSLQVGLASLPPDADAVIVHLVDHPFVKQETVRSIIDEFVLTSAAIVIPSHEYRRGHPLLFASRMFGKILTSQPLEGTRALLRTHEAEIHYAIVDDAGIRIDIDTREDYERYCAPS